MEKRLLTVDPRVGASTLDMGYQRLLAQQHHSQMSLPSSKGARINPKREENKQGTLPVPLKGDAVSFPRYLRQKTGVSEPYAAAIFKANRGQQLPLTRFIHVLPDLTYHIEVMNDLLSFHKEEMEGESFNMIHLRTQALRSASRKGSQGGWTLMDTFNLLCDEVREATFRIDAMLRLGEVEKRLASGERQRHGEEGVCMTVDEAIAKQWRGFRDGYISWHLESRRYKLDFLKAEYC
ncbi:hypothetical protein SERLA73DRAFT_173285 [Serpula lacrymans var. lacrymans S7.3]|uniref:Uncharacterized protein n=2 Tax=Serpula lacrymans var. lacrymans TaxID=341189 RepID=F8QIL1_SERL3|nr:uncharacterized protein SERLADRAFT_448516 [Serpula lacrymans var. lacrymans S7.9]EGN91850.1 hypothetical protein SERLA73DRAFT_173285 [Serpula lacrymans var. lacrymans S7.3]EGO25553.1 hypothetical protein SERLADRAFT_448516 [Serpula lacrymans var. lacrymans S7.9]